MTPEQLLSILHEDTAEVTFTKKNGEERTMICTLNEQYLPETDVIAEPKSFTGLLTVWDLDSDGWRSFHYDKIIEVEYDENGSVRREKLQ